MRLHTGNHISSISSGSSRRTATACCVAVYSVAAVSSLLLLVVGGGPLGGTFVQSYDYIVEPGPLVRATKGAVWPKPQQQQSTDRFLTLRPHSFRFHLVNNTCDILNEAIKRYQRLITNGFYAQRRRATAAATAAAAAAAAGASPPVTPPVSSRHQRLFEGTLDALNVDLKVPCEELPHHDMDEEYHLTVEAASPARLSSFSVWGALRGLETFSQLLHLADDAMSLRLNCTDIRDWPRFAHRGLLLDTGRHFMPMDTLRTVLDGMAYTKLNVFHWHIVDDQSFPWQSARRPELSARGAFAPHAVYTANDTAAVVAYARLRGIRVMVELDTPGHVRSWGVAHPELLTQCGGDWAGELGPLDPSEERVYPFVEGLLTELADTFPERYMHLGGDEVGFKCWRSNANITRFMEQHALKTYEALEEHYMQRLLEIPSRLGVSSVVWEEVFTNGVRLRANETLVHVWKAGVASLLKLAEVTASGLRALDSHCWYLDHLETGVDWKKFYDCDPHEFIGTAEQKKLVVGGEACMWSESVNEFNVVPRIYPRACAAAEKLWSAEAATKGAANYEEARHRLEEHTCRMNGRGVAAQPPNGPGYCY